MTFNLNFNLTTAELETINFLTNKITELHNMIPIISNNQQLRTLAESRARLSSIIRSIDGLHNNFYNIQNIMNDLVARGVSELAQRHIFFGNFNLCQDHADFSQIILERFLENNNFVLRNGEFVLVTSDSETSIESIDIEQNPTTRIESETSENVSVESIDIEQNPTTAIQSEASENVSVESIDIEPDRVIVLDNQARELESMTSTFSKLMSMEISRPIKCNLIEKLSSKHHSVSVSPVMVASWEKDGNGINRIFCSIQLQANFAISNLKPTDLKPGTKVSIGYKNSKVSLQKFTNNAENTYSASIEKKIQLKNQQAEISATFPFSNGKIEIENFHVSTKSTLPGGNLVKHSKNSQNYFLSVKPSIQLEFYPILDSTTLANQEKDKTNLCGNENYCFDRSSSDCHEVDDWPDCTVNSQHSLHDYSSVYDNNVNISGNRYQVPKKISTVCIDPSTVTCNYQSKNTGISMGFFSLVGIVAVGISYRIIKSLKTKFNK